MGDSQIFLFISGGLVALVVGGEFLVRGATGIAVAAGVSSLVIGLTVVAFGTSMPELVVSLQAAAAGSPGIAVANVVGSNIFNILFILGLCGMIAPLAVSSQLVRIDVPLMIFGSLLVYIFAFGGKIMPWQGLLLLAVLTSYTIFIVKRSRRETRAVKAEYDEALSDERAEVKNVPVWLSAVLVLVGLFVLVLGARWLIDGSVALARRFGVSETVIGLTIVAGGTSLPEVAASVMATIKGERDIAIGNIVGSSSFNLFAILGFAPIFSGGLPVAPEMLNVDFPVMVIAAIACFPHFVAGLTFNRIEGLLFFISYAGYTTWLVLQATGSLLRPDFERVVMTIVLPVLVPVVLLVLWSKYRLSRSMAKKAKSS
ncbi:MAG: calcium/sodium antiporter [Turneriella sp.]